MFKELKAVEEAMQSNPEMRDFIENRLQGMDESAMKQGFRELMIATWKAAKGEN